MPHAVAGVERAGRTNSHLPASAMLEPQAPASEVSDRNEGRRLHSDITKKKDIK